MAGSGSDGSGTGASRPLQWMKLLIDNPQTCNQVCQTWFKKYDVNQNCQLEQDEFLALYVDLCSFVGVEPPTEDQLQRSFKKADRNRDKVLSADEFTRVFQFFLKQNYEEVMTNDSLSPQELAEKIRKQRLEREAAEEKTRRQREAVEERKRQKREVEELKRAQLLKTPQYGDNWWNRQSFETGCPNCRSLGRTE
eukprot:gnl/MRDRNA2_/MRDRNA2_71522_c0_seq1.p1 gnl/MRDRNA2_/MRDRNA2_71522_c0~~gnl/MRDRNA2_/MRDRNA2_71522_c0_seq1.p1  ORF type:complete len:214 (-),score=54.13 gnl/MRDRNA2_/MRDRNA2_71522_c0_seq1:863-1447(-)